MVFVCLFFNSQCENEPALVPTVMTFLENHGKNIQLSNQNLTAARVSSYNQGLLVTAQALPRQQLFQVCVCVSVFGSERHSLCDANSGSSSVSDRPSESIMDVLPVAGCDWSFTRPPQLPFHSLLP